jgi:O-antigen/teichoic acid export membrane protein
MGAADSKRKGGAMKSHLANAAWGILDYAAYPVGMLLVAPVILRNMGAAQYGVWTIATAVVSIGSIIAAGFGDANIQHVATQRGVGRSDLLLRTVQCMMSINIVLGSGLSVLTWIATPFAARHLVPLTDPIQQDCLWSLRLASILIGARTMESLCISTQRGFERYGPAVRISLAARLLSLAIAAALTYFARSVAVLVAATVTSSLFGTWLQFKQLRKLLQSKTLKPILDYRLMKALFGFGIFSWLQAVVGVLFGQVDRLYLGLSSGAVIVASYALCVQISQPIYGIAASGLHFLFPYIAERRASRTQAELRRTVLVAFAVNLLIVAAISLALVMAGPGILRAWSGGTIQKNSFSVLPIIVAGSALVGINVTATYSLFALGLVRIVTWFNLAAGTVMLVLVGRLAPHSGAYGLAVARLGYGAITLLLYVPLIRRLSRERASLPMIASEPVCEDL